jgi:heterodisulfide reductase subunit C2
MNTAAIIELKKDSHVIAMDHLSKIQEMVRSCIQCGTCTGSCPNTQSMDYTPRQLWRMVLMGQKDLIYRSKTFALVFFLLLLHIKMPSGPSPD